MSTTLKIGCIESLYCHRRMKKNDNIETSYITYA